MPAEHSFPRAERLDADRMADAAFQETGTRLTVEGPCAGGQVGAAFVRWPDGRRSVLKWRPDVLLDELLAGPLSVVGELRAAGSPVPGIEFAVQIGSAVVTVQELLPGAKIDYLSVALLEQALAFNAAMADVLVARPDIPLAKLYLREDGGGYCLHEPLRRYSRRAASLERWVAEVGRAYPDDHLAGDDAMHLDFHPGNMLAAENVLTGVIDWDGAGRGDRRFDLVTMRFGIHHRDSEAGVIEQLDALLDQLPDDILRPAWAHMSLRQVDWSIRHHSDQDVEAWLDLAERRAG